MFRLSSEGVVIPLARKAPSMPVMTIASFCGVIFSFLVRYAIMAVKNG